MWNKSLSNPVWLNMPVISGNRPLCERTSIECCPCPLPAELLNARGSLRSRIFQKEALCQYSRPRPWLSPPQICVLAFVLIRYETALCHQLKHLLRMLHFFFAQPDTDHRPIIRSTSASPLDQSRRFHFTTTSMVKAEELPISPSPNQTRPQKLRKNRTESRSMVDR